jgi:hypothetical protein
MSTKKFLYFLAALSFSVVSERAFAQAPMFHAAEFSRTNINTEALATSTATPAMGATATCSANVKGYGAIGNGSADDTNAIQAAISANPGGNICFPSGVYQISKCLLIPSLTTLTGSGSVNHGWATTGIYNTVLRLISAGTTACMVMPSNITDGNYQKFSLRDMTFDGGAGDGGYVSAGGAYLDLQNTYDMTELSNIMVSNYLNAPAIRIGPGLAGIGTGPIMKLDHIWVDGYTQATSLGAGNGFNNQVGLEIDNYYSSTSHTGWVNGGVISNFEVIGTGTAPGVHVKSTSNGGSVRWFVFEGLTVFGLANASTPAVQIDGMANSTFRDTFVGLPSGGTAFLLKNAAGDASNSNLLFEGIYGDGANITYLNNQAKGVVLTAPVSTYMAH